MVLIKNRSFNNHNGSEPSETRNRTDYEIIRHFCKPWQCFCLVFIIFFVMTTYLLSSRFHDNLIVSVYTNTIGAQNTTIVSTCQWKYDHYIPSQWELSWYNNIDTLQKNVCSILMQKEEISKSIQSLQYIINLQKTLYRPSSGIDKANELLSKIYYRRECTDLSKSQLIVCQSIEPLIGLLRDPLTMCPHIELLQNLTVDGWEPIQSKRFFLLGPSAPYKNYEPSESAIPPWLLKPGAQKILFDIGASYFNGMNAAAVPTSTIGTRWFYEYFGSKSLSFDRIIAFEATQSVPESYWNQIPDDVIGKLTFINTGVNTTGKLNPWNILKTIAKPEDYVIIKLDIDTSPLELTLCNQVLNDTSISSLIDEMFFEMHVTINEMMPYWGSPPGELKDTYILFRKLREIGIRMHSWP